MGFFYGEFMDDWGIDIKTGAAGLCGGFFALLVMRDLSIKQALASIIGGFLAALYCTNWLMHIINIPHEFAGGVGFAVGVFGLAVVGKALVLIQSLTVSELKDLSVQWVRALVEPIIDALKKGGGK